MEICDLDENQFWTTKPLQCIDSFPTDLKIEIVQSDEVDVVADF